MTEKQIFAISTGVLTLSHFCEVTPRMFEVLLRRFLQVEEIFKATRDEILEIEGISEETADLIVSASDRYHEAVVLEQSLRQREIELITRFDENYPTLLFELHDPAPLLFVRGKAPTHGSKSVAVIGCRQASAAGIELTSRLVKELVANDVQIISSLNGGIDAAAHLAARTSGGHSYAVIDSGIDQLMQREDVPLAIDIVHSGGLISEHLPEVEATEETTSQAHRLLVGMAGAVVVTEAYKDSAGTLDLLRACNEVGKLVFFMVDPELGALADDDSLGVAVECGAIPLEGWDKVKDLLKSLV